MACGRDGATGCCLDITGGSFANISRRIARKSRIFDFCYRQELVVGRILNALP